MHQIAVSQETVSKLTLLAAHRAKKSGVETRNNNFIYKAGRPMSQNIPLMGSGCQFFLQNREGEEVRK